MNECERFGLLPFLRSLVCWKWKTLVTLIVLNHSRQYLKIRAHCRIPTKFNIAASIWRLSSARLTRCLETLSVSSAARWGHGCRADSRYVAAPHVCSCRAWSTFPGSFGWQWPHYKRFGWLVSRNHTCKKVHTLTHSQCAVLCWGGASSSLYLRSWLIDYVEANNKEVALKTRKNSPRISPPIADSVLIVYCSSNHIL